MARLSVIIPDETKAMLDVIAEKQDRNLSYIVRKALDQYIERETSKEN